MHQDVKSFIEKNVVYLEQRDYDAFYDEAYEWLTDAQVAELTTIIETTLDVEAKRYAKENLLKHFLIETTNFVADNHDWLTIPSFVRLYMNHLNGIEWKEFNDMIRQYSNLHPNSNFVVARDFQGDVVIKKRD